MRTGPDSRQAGAVRNISLFVASPVSAATFPIPILPVLLDGGPTPSPARLGGHLGSIVYNQCRRSRLSGRNHLPRPRTGQIEPLCWPLVFPASLQVFAGEHVRIPRSERLLIDGVTRHDPRAARGRLEHNRQEAVALGRRPGQKVDEIAPTEQHH